MKLISSTVRIYPKSFKGKPLQLTLQHYAVNSKFIMLDKYKDDKKEKGTFFFSSMSLLILCIPDQANSENI